MSKFNLQEVMEKHGGKCRNGLGDAIRIVSTDLNDPPYSVVGILTDSGNGGESVETYTADGRFHRHEVGDNDLIMPPERIELWVPIPKDRDTTIVCQVRQNLHGVKDIYYDQVHVVIEDGMLVSAEVVK